MSVRLAHVIEHGSGKFKGSRKFDLPVSVQVVVAFDASNSQIVRGAGNLFDLDVSGTGRNGDQIVVAGSQIVVFVDALNSVARSAITTANSASVRLFSGSQLIIASNRLFL